MTITNSFWFANIIIYLQVCGVEVLGIPSEQQVMTDSHQYPIPNSLEQWALIPQGYLLTF